MFLIHNEQLDSLRQNELYDEYHEYYEYFNK